MLFRSRGMFYIGGVESLSVKHDVRVREKQCAHQLVDIHRRGRRWLRESTVGKQHDSQEKVGVAHGYGNRILQFTHTGRYRSIIGRLGHLVDNPYLDRGSGLLKLQAQLILKGGKKIRSDIW